MIPLYVPASKAAILDYGTRCVHPDTGEVYGGTDYDDAAKIAQIGAVPLRVLTPAEGLSVVEWVVEDDLQNPGGKQYRPVMLRVELPAAGSDAATWEVVDDPAHPGDLLKRPATTTPWDKAAEVAKRISDVNAERARRLEALTVIYNGWTFEANEQSRANLTGVVAAIGAGVQVGVTVGWRDADDVVRDMTPAQLGELAGAMLVEVQAMYAKSWTLKDITIPGLRDAAAVRAFDVRDNSLWA